MTQAENRRKRVATKIAASQNRLDRDAPAKKPPPKAAKIPARKAEPPETISGLARDYPILIVLGGLAVGVLAASLLPRGAARRLATRAAALAAVAGELGVTFGHQAYDKAGDAARDGREKLGEGLAIAAREGRHMSAKLTDSLGETLTLAAKEGRDKFGEVSTILGEVLSEAPAQAREQGKKAVETASDAAGSALDTGIKLARAAIRMAASVRR